MAREIIVSIWCDLHLAEDEHVEGQEIPPLVMGAGKPRVLALCDVHRKEIYDPLLEALAELGQPVGGDVTPGSSKRMRRGAGGDVACPVEGCPYTGPSNGALGKHTKSHHGATVGELERGVEPLPASPESSSLICPECGKHFTMAKGLGAHRSRAHGVAGTSSTARQARAKRAGK